MADQEDISAQRREVCRKFAEGTTFEQLSRFYGTRVAEDSIRWGLTTPQWEATKQKRKPRV